MKKIFISSLAALLLATPLIAGAQADIEGFLSDTVLGIINLVLQLLIAVATLVFIWGVILYIIAGADEDKTARARSVILWGVIGLVLIVAVWGLVRIIATGLFGEDTEPLPPPTFDIGGGGGAG